MRIALSVGRIWRGGASLVCAALGLVVALSSGACPRASPVVKPPPHALALGGVRIERLTRDAVPMGPSLQGRAGDWVMATDGLRLVVGGDSERGALLDLVAQSWQDDALTELRPIAIVNGVEETFELGSIEPIELGGRAALRIAHVARARGLLMLTDVHMLPGRRWLELVTSLKHVGKGEALRVKLGDRVSWIGRAPFAPGLGFVEKATRAKLSWFARGGGSLSYALAFPDGARDVEFVTTLRGPTEQIATTLEQSLPPDAVVSQRRVIVAVAGALPAVAGAAWQALGVPTGSVLGAITPMPEWARLVAHDARNRVVLDADVADSGRFELALPAGKYRLELLAPGGSDVEALEVTAGRARPARFIVPEAARIAYRISDPSGKLRPARIVLRGVAPTADPKLGPSHLASGAGNIAYTRSGEGTLAVPPGRYTFMATSGLEYSIAQLELEVSEKRGATLRAELEHVVPTPGWIACDFHLHAEPSGDSDVPLVDRVTSLLAEGIELAVATDHNHVTDYGPAITTLGASDALVAATGVEITTPSWGHFNAFPYPADAGVPPYAEVAPAAIFEHVRRVSPGAVIQINHPRMAVDIGYFDLGRLDVATGIAAREGFSWTFDTIEVFNGFELGRPELVQKNMADWYALLDLGRLYTAVGNSDSHMLISQWTGYPRTYVEVGDAPTPAAVASALRAGRAQVTSGPIIELSVAGVGPGRRVKAAQGKVKVEIGVRAAPWVDVRSVELVVDGEKRVSFDIAPDATRVERAKLTHELSLERDAWVIAIARGEKELEQVLPGSRERPFAFTNPVFVDVDGDGAFSARRASQP